MLRLKPPRRTSVSLEALKKSLVTKGSLVQTKGAGASGSFKINKKVDAKVKKPAAAKESAPKSPKKETKSPKKVTKKPAAKKVLTKKAAKTKVTKKAPKKK